MSAPVERAQRFSRAHPCPICGGYDSSPRGHEVRCFGFLSDDGKWAHCTREEHAGDLVMESVSSTCAHRLAGACKCGVTHGAFAAPASSTASSGRSLGTIVAQYRYCDEHGELLFEAVRFVPKTFRQRRPAGFGKWIWDLKGVRRVLYRLPELLAADPETPVFIVEGEKDVDRVRGLGMVATCNPMGARKWHFVSKEAAAALKGRHVVIIPDKDPEGRAHAEEVARALAGIAASVRILELPGAGKDASDWIEAGGTAEELVSLAMAAPEAGPKKPPTGTATARPAILLGPNLRDIVLEAERALAGEPNVFQRAGAIVEVLRQEASPATSGTGRGIRRTVGAPVIHTIAPAKLRLHLAACATWKRQQEDKLVSVAPPDWAVHGLSGYGEWATLRPLTAVVEAPVLRPDGSILDTPGYDTATGLVYVPNLDLGPMPARSTLADSREALAVLDRLVVDFPFESVAHRAGWKAGLLTPFARTVIDGPCPLFLIDANVAAAGKGLLAELCALIFSGRVPALMSQAPSEDEERKRITTALLGGDAIILIDNLTGPFGSGALDAALTAREWCDRVLGVNRSVRLPLLATWWATGNNVILVGDTHRRVVHIRLESPHERPEERDDFTHRDLRAHALEHRVELVRAAVTVLAAYVQAGRPDVGLRTWGSFERWSELIRGALVWAGDADPFEARAELIARADTERAALAALIDAIAHKWPRGVTVAEILRLLDETSDLYPDPNAELRTAVAELCPARAEVSPKALGSRLRRLRGRVIGGRALDELGKEHGVAIWGVRTVTPAVVAPAGGETLVLDLGPVSS